MTSFIQKGEKELIAKTAQTALNRIESHGLSLTPQIYEVWYTYYARTKPDLIRAIDSFLESKATITDNVCEDFYERYLSDYKNEERIRSAGEQLQNTISEVSESMVTVKTATTDYSETLQDMNQKLNSSDVEVVKHITAQISERTKIMLEQNKALEEKLRLSSEIMEDLKRDLEFVRREAVTDGLTGLANRKAFDSESARYIAEAKAENKVLTLLMVDIDHFKNFNDKFGHQVGDQVLKLVARTLKDGLKGRDFAARYGGEEFAILLPETGIEGGVAVGNSLRKALANKDVVNRTTGTILGRITMSIGVSEYRPELTIEDLIEKADKALYEAKNQGRNQVIAAG